VIIIVPAGTSGPDWASRWTAIGTIALAVLTLAVIIATIVITGQDRRRADKALIAQQEHAEALRREDREHAQEAEQLAEAWAVEVIPHVWPESRDGSTKRLSVSVTNLGSYTITRVAARFSPEGTSLISYESAQRITEDSGVYPLGYDDRAAGFTMSGYEGILTRGTGLSFRSDPIDTDKLAGPYPVVRWTDRWGQRWEHRKGRVERIEEDEPWSP
jgi:hypothetical protein